MESNRVFVDRASENGCDVNMDHFTQTCGQSTGLPFRPILRREAIVPLDRCSPIFEESQRPETPRIWPTRRMESNRGTSRMTWDQAMAGGNCGELEMCTAEAGSVAVNHNAEFCFSVALATLCQLALSTFCVE